MSWSGGQPIAEPPVFCQALISMLGLHLYQSTQGIKVSQPCSVAGLNPGPVASCLTVYPLHNWAFHNSLMFMK